MMGQDLANDIYSNVADSYPRYPGIRGLFSHLVLSGQVPYTGME